MKVRFAPALLFAVGVAAGSSACSSDPEPPGGLPLSQCVAPARPKDATIRLEAALGDQAFQSPVDLVEGPGKRFYVVEQGGRVRVVEPGASTSTLAIDIAARITSGGEAGLLSVAFDPAFTQNGFVYLHFTSPVAGPVQGTRVFESVIARYQSKDGGLTFDPSTEKRVIAVDQPFSNHNAGKIAFGPDGNLYFGLGDGGSGGDPQGHGQNTGTLLGTIVRIDPKGDPYAVPPTNPFVGGGGRPEIYAYGLRNPWKIAFDPATGDLWAGDVGQGKYEEIDRITLGGNYGWRTREGAHCYNADTCETQGLIDPVVEYGRSDGFSVTAGHVYRGAKIPALLGKLIFGDFGTGRIWAVDRDANGASFAALLLASDLRISTFGQGSDGEVYVADYATGRVKVILPSDGGGPTSAPTLLSATGCLDAADPSKGAPGLVAYEVNAPLWSDGAEKQRWVSVPEGKKIGVAPDGDMEVPSGSVLVKTFVVDGKRVETRLFARYADGGYVGYSYEWADDQRDATLLAEGKTKDLGGGKTWTFPSRGQCFACHTPQAGVVLGLEVRQLDRVVGGENQLARFAPLLAAPVTPGASPPLKRLTDPGTDEERARSYLHANCAMCHRAGAGAGAAKIDLHIDRSFAELGACDVPPSAGDLGVAGSRIFLPGDPARSTLALRMRALDTNRMPTLATRVVDEDGARAVEAWIRGVSACP